MNLYRLAKDLNNFIEECQEVAKNFPEIGGHFDALDPFTREFERDPSVLKETGNHNMEYTNFRIDIFENERGDLVWACYSPQTAACNPKMMNSHAFLANLLREKHSINIKKRWCGFYSRVTGNSDNMLILYGMSSDYPHNQYSEEIVERFAKEILKDTWGPSKVIVIGESFKTYTR